MTKAVILEALRTPFGRHSGALSWIRPDRLLANLLIQLLQRVEVGPEHIDDVVVGTVTQIDEQGANLGRQAVLLAGMPVHVPATTLNRMCSSSQQAVHFCLPGHRCGGPGLRNRRRGREHDPGPDVQ